MTDPNSKKILRERMGVATSWMTSAAPMLPRRR
jgi:hypothetical protein